MQPFPAPNSVIVMDNCRIHKHPDIVDLIHSRYVWIFVADRIWHMANRGMKCEFLPPYSPDLNPIELAFSAMKYHLRRDGAYNRMAMTEMLDEEIHILLLKALYIISPQDSYGWYRYCGYIWVDFVVYPVLLPKLYDFVLAVINSFILKSLSVQKLTLSSK